MERVPRVITDSSVSLVSAAKILLVDDDEDFRRGFAENLRDDGYGVSDYATPADLPDLEALSDVKLVITDYNMAPQDGLSFADAFHDRHPEVPIVLVTAFPGAEVDQQVARRDFLSWQTKPIDYDNFTLLLHNLVSA